MAEFVAHGQRHAYEQVYRLGSRNEANSCITAHPEAIRLTTSKALSYLLLNSGRT
jgi:hypothetical protein